MKQYFMSKDRYTEEMKKGFFVPEEIRFELEEMVEHLDSFKGTKFCDIVISVDNLLGNIEIYNNNPSNQTSKDSMFQAFINFCKKIVIDIPVKTADEFEMFVIDICDENINKNYYFGINCLTNFATILASEIDVLVERSIPPIYPVEGFDSDYYNIDQERIDQVKNEVIENMANNLAPIN